MAKGNSMTDQDSWRQQVERQLADLLYRVAELESSIEDMGSRQYQQVSDLQKIDRRLTAHTGKERKNPHG
jgi:hypothetical protein